MKASVAGIVALAVGASASPLRLITLEPFEEHHAPHISSLEIVSPQDVVERIRVSSESQRGRPDEEEPMRILPHPHHHSGEHHRPCGQNRGSSGGPLGALLSRLGLRGGAHHPHRFHEEGSDNPHGHHFKDHDHDHGHGHHHIDAEGAKQRGNALIEAWKSYVDHAFGAGPGGVNFVPVMEGGIIRLPSEFNLMGEMPVDHRMGHATGTHLRPHGGHRWQHQSSLTERLHRAIVHLSTVETLIIAFVLGAGLGSILHLCFVMLILLARRFRAGKQRRMKRREARREARRLKHQRKGQSCAQLAKVDDEKVQLARVYSDNEVDRLSADGVEEEVLPAYADGETDRLVEKV